jgi:hypothetical protein
LASLPQPVSLVAERAVRYLRDRSDGVDSRRMAQEVLALRVTDETTARRLLESAFGGDPRLAYGDLGWRVVDQTSVAVLDAVDEPDRALVFLRGIRPPGERFHLERVAVMRLRQEDVVGACGGDVAVGSSNRHLREAITDALDGAMIVIHDPPGGLAAFERWLGVPVPAPVSLRRMAQRRLGLPASHDLETLAARLGLMWRSSEDPLEQADILDACLKALLRPRETLGELARTAAGNVPPIDWSRFAFDRDWVHGLPTTPGTYRFFDRDGALLYVGKAKDLRRRVGSYFQDGGLRPVRVQHLLDRLHRIEYETSGSELEAILREAEQIRRDSPERNVMRRHRPRDGRRDRLRSILILEPAEPPAVLRAFLICGGRLISRVAIGPRGGGLARIERLLDDHCFLAPDGPTPAPGPDLDVELVVRWLAANRDRAVAFDPTDLRSAGEVTGRLRWFLSHGSPFEPDGSPILPR